ncbi:MAG: diphthine synthase [Candidatus Micrarchaeia archaeon]
MLFLIGAGLSNEDLSIAAINSMKASKLYIDAYTSFIDDDRISFLEGIAGQHATMLSRSQMEEGASRLVAEARDLDIAIVVGGDPLIATTHKIIASEAQKAGIELHVIHAVSVFSVAIGESGLDFYRFGAVCTIPKWREHYKPVSFYETLQRNIEMNLHSLLLLDYDSNEKASISISEAISVLQEAEAHYKWGIIRNDTFMIIENNLSGPQELKIAGPLSAISTVKGISGASVIIIPAKITEVESEAISSMGIKLLR